MKPYIESPGVVRKIGWIMLLTAAGFLAPSTGLATWLPTLSPTWPITPSPQVTPGCTAACTMTVAATPGCTAACTMTAAATPGCTAACTMTVSPTPTSKTCNPQSYTPTSTPTPTATATSKTPGHCTKSPTLTPTATSTPTETSTITPTGTPTSRRTPEGPVVFPNPWDGTGPVKVWLRSETVVQNVNLKVFTTSYRMIAEVNYPNLAPTDRVISWDGRDRKDRPLANGPYHLLLETASGTYRLKLAVVK